MVSGESIGAAFDAPTETSNKMPIQNTQRITRTSPVSVGFLHPLGLEDGRPKGAEHKQMEAANARQQKQSMPVIWQIRPNHGDARVPAAGTDASSTAIPGLQPRRAHQLCERGG